MAKIYSYEKFLKKQEIKNLTLDLKERMEYCKKHGIMWIDQYAITEIKRRIMQLTEELKTME